MRNVSKLAGRLIALVCFVAEPTWAQCIAGPEVDGRTPVACDGDSSAGFAAPLDTDNFDVTINAAATVKDGNGSEAILVNGNSSIINGTYQTTDPIGVIAGGAIVIENTGAAGMRVEAGKTGSYLQNEGAISAGSMVLAIDGTVGMQAGDDNAVMNGVNGSITIFGDDARGIEVGGGSSVDVTDAAGLNLSDPSLSGQAVKTVENHGMIEIHGANGIGIMAGDRTNRMDGGVNFGVWNSSEGTSPASILVTGGDGGIGILVGDNSGVVNQGSVTIEGNDGTGIQAGNGVRLRNEGIVSATGVDSRGIEIGDDALLDNQATGEIHGGSGPAGYALWFRGVNAFANNILNNDGLIESTGPVAIEGSEGSEEINLNDGSTVIGDLRMNGGDDLVILDGMATLTGNVSLGDGQDFFVMTGAGGVYDGDVIGGAGPDGLVLIDTAIFTGNFFGKGNDDSVQISDGATATGTFDLGSGRDKFTLFEGATFDGSLFMGAGNDTIDLRKDSVFNAASLVLLENGDDQLALSSGAMFVGDLDTGTGADRVGFQDGTSFTGDLTMGDGDDTLSQVDEGNAMLDGDVDLGLGADTVDLNSGLVVTGTIDMGAGDDIFKIHPGEGIPSNLIPGAGDDILHLFQRKDQGVGTIELGIASDFEALLIGPDNASNASAWTIATDAPRMFSGGVVLQTGDLRFDGIVELVADFSQQANSTLVFDLGRDIVDSKLDLTGALTLETGAELEIKIAGGILEDSYTLIETTGGIAGSFDALIFPNLATFGFATEFVGDDFVLTVTRTSAFADFGRTASERRVADYVDEILFSAGPSAIPETTAALEVLDEGELNTALGQLHPEIYDAHTSSILSWGRMQQRMLHERPLRCDRFQYAPRPEIVSESPCGTRRFVPWAKVVGTFGRHSGGEPKGYDAIGGGVLLGVDHRWKDDIWFSGDIGFAHVDVESDNGADGGFDSIDLGVAAAMVRGALSLRSSMTYSHGFHETTRDLDFLGDRVKGKFDSDRITLAAGVGYRFDLGHFIVEPNATIDYTHVAEESLNETGHDEVALDVSSRKTDLFAVTTGVRLSTNFLKYRYAGRYLEWADGVWSPVLSVQWRQAVGDVDRDQKATMRAAPGDLGSFKSKASDSEGGLEVGSHISFQPLKSSATVEIGYDAYIGDEVTNHTIKATVRLPF